MSRKALGRGLEALLAEASVSTSSTPSDGPTPPLSGGNLVLDVPVDSIQPNPDQPRTLTLDQASLEDLAASVSSQGILQPLLVSSDPEGGYTLIAGERRLQAAKLAGLATVPVLVKEVTPTTRLAMALIENIQRRDLNVLEEAQAYARLVEEFGLTQEAVAQAVGRDRATVANLVRLLRLPQPVQGDLLEGRLTMGHARALLGLLESGPKLLAARAKVLAKSLTVRQTESLVEQLRKPAKTPSPEPVVVQLKAEEDRLRSALGTKVSISRKGQAGRIVIEFFSDDELTRLLDLFQSLGLAE